MVRLYFYVEGQTEQEYVTRLLVPPWQDSAYT